MRWDDLKRYKFLKRVLDIIIAYFLLLFLYFPMLIIALSIYVIDGGPIIFKQVRVGKNGRTFVCYKFRTMYTSAPRNLSTEEFKNASEYVTRTGAFLRKTSLDELPQLLNVLAGEMSIIGPRPLIPEEKELHSLRKKTGVYEARPGITGLAQICGRDRLSNERKLECDVIYAENMCLINDIKILKGTVFKIIKGDGVKSTSILDTEASK